MIYIFLPGVLATYKYSTYISGQKTGGIIPHQDVPSKIKNWHTRYDLLAMNLIIARLVHDF